MNGLGVFKLPHFFNYPPFLSSLYTSFSFPVLLSSLFFYTFGNSRIANLIFPVYTFHGSFFFNRRSLHYFVILYHCMVWNYKNVFLSQIYSYIN